MRRVLAFVLLLIMISLTACSPDPKPVITPTPAPTSSPTPAPTPTPTPEPTPTPTPEPTPTPTPEPTPTSQTTVPPVHTVHPGSPGNAFRVPACAPVDDDYFTDAVYIGDSRAEGLRLYSGIKCTFLSYVGQSIHHIYNSRVERMACGITTSIYDALSKTQYSKIYINLGMNDFYYGLAAYSSCYRAVLDKIMQLQPNATIYLVTLSPVNEQMAINAGYNLSNAGVENFNQQIRAIALERQVYYIESSECFPYLDASLTGDGLHLNAPASQRFYAYLKTRVVDTAASNPTPTPTSDPEPTPTPASDPSPTPTSAPTPTLPPPPVPTLTPDPTPDVSAIPNTAESITLNHTEFTIADQYPNPVTIKVVFYPYNTTGQVSWSSSDNEIITVDANGTVRHGTTRGSAIITATLYNGQTATCKVINRVTTGN